MYPLFFPTLAKKVRVEMSASHWTVLTARVRHTSCVQKVRIHKDLVTIQLLSRSYGRDVVRNVKQSQNTNLYFNSYFHLHFNSIAITRTSSTSTALITNSNVYSNDTRFRLLKLISQKVRIAIDNYSRAIYCLFRYYFCKKKIDRILAKKNLVVICGWERTSGSFEIFRREYFLSRVYII